MSSDISLSSGMHNQVEVPDERPTSSTQENGSDLENLREPQDHSPASLWPSIHQQLEQSPFEKLPPEMKEEIAEHLSRNDISRLSQANRDLHRQFNEAAHKSRNKSQEIEKGARQIRKTTRRQLDISSKFAAQMTQLSRQRPADQARDLNTFLKSGPRKLPPDQAAQLWSQLLKHPIDKESMRSMARLARFSQLPVDKSTGIVKGLLDQIERQSSEGSLPKEEEIRDLDHPLEIAARMVRHMPPQEQQAAAARIRVMAESQNRPLEKIDHFLNEELL